jgi:hypothetical protein
MNVLLHGRRFDSMPRTNTGSDVNNDTTATLWWVHGDGKNDTTAIGTCINGPMLSLLRNTLEYTYVNEPERPKREVRRALQSRAEGLPFRERELRERGTLSECQIVTQLASLADSQLPECEDRLVARAACSSRATRLEKTLQLLEKAREQPVIKGEDQAGSSKTATRQYSKYDDEGKVEAMFRKFQTEAAVDATRPGLWHLIVAPEEETQEHVKEAMHQRMRGGAIAKSPCLAGW